MRGWRSCSAAARLRTTTPPPHGAARHSTAALTLTPTLTLTLTLTLALALTLDLPLTRCGAALAVCEAMEAHPADAPLQRAASLAVRWLGGDEASAKTYSQLCLGNAVALECCALRLGAKTGRPSSPSGARAPTPSSGSVRGGIAVQMAGLQALWLTLTPTLTPTLTLTKTLTLTLT